MDTGEANSDCTRARNKTLLGAEQRGKKLILRERIIFASNRQTMSVVRRQYIGNRHGPAAIKQDGIAELPLLRGHIHMHDTCVVPTSLVTSRSFSSGKD